MNPETIAALLADTASIFVDSEVTEKLAVYLSLLMKWNERTNLSAIRDPEQIVLRHFGESLQCAQVLPPELQTLLDYGSGGGFPGALCSLMRPEIRVVLAESQNKKAAFLQELCRTLSLNATVHAGRVEEFPAERQFDAVTLRAVDRMEEACFTASKCVKTGKWLIVLTTKSALPSLASSFSTVAWELPVPLKGSRQNVIALGRVLAEQG